MNLNPLGMAQPSGSYLHRNKIHEIFQSVLRHCYSTETALIKVINGLLLASDQGCFSLLVLLDLEDFNIIDYNVILVTLENFVGVNRMAISWLSCCLNDHLNDQIVDHCSK